MNSFARYWMAVSFTGGFAALIASFIGVSPIASATAASVAALICLIDAYRDSEIRALEKSEPEKSPYTGRKCLMPSYEEIMYEQIPQSGGLFSFLGSDNRLICRGGLIAIQCCGIQMVSSNPLQIFSVSAAEAVSVGISRIAQGGRNEIWLHADQIQWLEAWSYISKRHAFSIMMNTQKTYGYNIKDYPVVHYLNAELFNDDAQWWDVCKEAGPLFRSSGRFPWRMSEKNFIEWLKTLGMVMENSENVIHVKWDGNIQENIQLPMPDKIIFESGNVRTEKWNRIVEDAGENGPRALLCLIECLRMSSVYSIILNKRHNQ